MSASADLPREILQWIEDVAGATVERADQRPGGARKEAWFIDVRRADGEIDELFLRYDRGDPAARGDPWTLHREATVYLALQDTYVPVPRVVAVHPTAQAMLTVRLAGENWFSRITDAGEQLAVAQDFMTRLAALHRLDPRALSLPGFPEPASVPDVVHHELDEWEHTIAARGGEPAPELRFALGWLRDNIPDYEGPVVLVQGDTGPGNFMYADGKVIAIVDWELAHFGDPMDDIAWLSLRAVQEPFTHLPDRLAEYRELSGHAIDEERVHYYRVMAETKLLVMTHAPGGVRHRGAGDVGNSLIYRVLHRRLWLEAIADVVGIEEQQAEVPPPSGEREVDWLYQHVLDELRDVVAPRVSDPLALQRTKGVARVLKYLAEMQRHSAFFEQRELDDIEGLLGRRPDSIEEGRAQVTTAMADGTIADNDYLRYLWKCVARENELLRPASGVLADRHWPPLH